MNFLIQLSENDKRILISLGILLILLFVIVGYIGLLVERIMKHQAKKAGTMMHDVVAAKVVTNEKDFRKFGKKKNNRLFVKQIYPSSLWASFRTELEYLLLVKEMLDGLSVHTP